MSLLPPLDPEHDLSPEELIDLSQLDHTRGGMALAKLIEKTVARLRGVIEDRPHMDSADLENSLPVALGGLWIAKRLLGAPGEARRMLSLPPEEGVSQ